MGYGMDKFRIRDKHSRPATLLGSLSTLSNNLNFIRSLNGTKIQNRKMSNAPNNRESTTMGKFNNSAKIQES
jgi:hypothetical protein